MKLVIQIPCFNEEKMIGETIKSIPRQFAGIDSVEVLVIDDGSADRTVELAREAGADHIVSFTKNRGLATAFAAGLDEAIRLGADIIVNMDADNQHRAECIAELIQPVLGHEADIVIGVRNIEAIEDDPWIKKKLQRLGSWVARRVSGTDVSDAVCGFRAYSREAAMRLHVFSGYTYTLETIIQAGRSNMAIRQVEVKVNPRSRESRVVRSVLKYVSRQMQTMFRIYAVYRPLRFFATIGAVFFLAGSLLGLRYLYLYFVAHSVGHVQSLLLAAVLMVIGFQMVVLGILADLIAVNRKLGEECLYRLKIVDATTQHAKRHASTPTGR
jgi:glycosyltransferase involved in cell wall biosynthesis